MRHTERKERIQNLVSEYIDLYHTKRNTRLKSYWKEKVSGFGVNLFRADEPKKYSEIGTVPIVVDPCETIYSDLFDYSLKDYYTIPEVYLEMLLRQRINHFKFFMDDSPLRLEIPIWIGTYYEYSLFGVRQIYSDKRTPQAVFEILVETEEDLEKYEDIEIDKTGIIPLAKKFYEIISKHVEGSGLKVSMPCFNRGPFGILSQLMGFDKLFFKAYDDPDFIKKAFKIINNVRFQYEKWSNANYKTPLNTNAIFNDDVSCPIISPDFYKEFIYPAERDLNDRYRIISYWHSCGNCDDILELINKLNIETLNIGMAGNVDKYTKVFGNSSAYEICVHPINDVLLANYSEMTGKIEKILSICKTNDISAFVIMASALEGLGRDNIICDIKHIFNWLEIARRSVDNFIVDKEAR
jgi:uroporphyrinogen-III decarboxylase